MRASPTESCGDQLGPDGPVADEFIAARTGERGAVPARSSFWNDALSLPLDTGGAAERENVDLFGEVVPLGNG